MVCIYKNLHDRYGRQAGVRLFARSISIHRTSEPRFIYSTEPDDFLWELCNVVLLNRNSNFQFEFARACCQVMVVILPNKTRLNQLSVKKTHKIIVQYSYYISTLREISDGLSSNRQTGNFALKCKFAPCVAAYTYLILKYNSLFGI